jgi:Mpv17 / PMP22 family
LVFNPIYLMVWLTAFWYMEEYPTTKTQVVSSSSHEDSYGHKMKEHFPNILLANWAWWFPAQALTFRFVPIPFQVLATDCFDFLWSAYLSFTTSEMKDTRR